VIAEKHEIEDLDAEAFLGVGEDGADGVIHTRGRPQEQSSVDRARGDEVDLVRTEETWSVCHALPGSRNGTERRCSYVVAEP